MKLINFTMTAPGKGVLELEMIDGTRETIENIDIPKDAMAGVFVFLRDSQNAYCLISNTFDGKKICVFYIPVPEEEKAAERRKSESDISDIRYNLGLAWEEITTLKDNLEREMDKLDEREKEDTEAGFTLYLEHGLTIGTMFLYEIDNTSWIVTGIARDGFRLTRIGEGEPRKILLPARDPERVKKALPKIRVLGELSELEEESEEKA